MGSAEAEKYEYLLERLIEDEEESELFFGCVSSLAISSMSLMVKMNHSRLCAKHILFSAEKN